ESPMSTAKSAADEIGVAASAAAGTTNGTVERSIHSVKARLRSFFFIYLPPVFLHGCRRRPQEKRECAGQTAPFSDSIIEGERKKVKIKDLRIPHILFYTLAARFAPKSALPRRGALYLRCFLYKLHNLTFLILTNRFDTSKTLARFSMFCTKNCDYLHTSLFFTRKSAERFAFFTRLAQNALSFFAKIREKRKNNAHALRDIKARKRERKLPVQLALSFHFVLPRESARRPAYGSGSAVRSKL
ncbi:MAG: hypothetical protein IJU41_07795, partial [Clostridia bacterium]|nr:hypothetical protein [Clostridia bacterium]